MITKEMEAFVYTAKVGSFQKASELLFVSSTALIKRINAMEEELGFSLFNRSNKGLTLTAEGTVFLDVAQDMLHRYYTGIQAVKDASNVKRHPLRIGISPINPFNAFQWSDYYGTVEFPDFTCYMVPISGKFQDFCAEVMNLGGDVDIIPYFLGSRYLDVVSSSFCLARLPMRIAVPYGHPLCHKDKLTYEDLNGHDLITINSDSNATYRGFNQKILEQAPDTNLRFCNFIDFDTLNYAVHDRKLILAGDYLKSVHPLLQLVPVDWDLLLPYGLLYSKKPSAAVSLLLESFRQCGISGNCADAPIVAFP